LNQSFEALFEKIADDIRTNGFSVNENALPTELSAALLAHVHSLNRAAYHKAGIGRENDHELNTRIRKDEIVWITGETPVGQSWLNWTTQLQRFLNRRLFLGLFSFESHFAHYPEGAFYKTHVDAFHGEANRILSLVVYLNENWQPGDGGEIVLYQDDQHTNGLVVPPKLGTIVAFLSEEFPHEVLPTTTDRHSIAGWFRVNTSTGQHLDPPQ
jgi:SM-20-related protein